MDWAVYKDLCDTPNVFSRWMLEQTIDLVGNSPVAACLSSVLDDSPLAKPAGHRGGEATDMFVLELDSAEIRTVLALVSAGVARGETTPGTRTRGLGGFTQAWREYADYADPG